MTRHNPAYKTPGYVAVPTPIPDEDTNGGVVRPAPVVNGTASRTPTTLRLTASALPKSKKVEPADEEEEEEEEAGEDEDMDAEGEDDLPDFTGKTFQEAQEQIMEELINYEDQGLDIFQPFVVLPPRTLTDYYQLIKNPVSLKGVQKKVKGAVGRNPATGATVLNSWDAFEEEFSYIWRNAQEYNEDGSDIFNLSNELKVNFPMWNIE